MAGTLRAADGANAILSLARRDRRAAEKALAGLRVDECVALICGAPVARRGPLLSLLDHPERVIPELPEAELCYTAKAVGLHDAGWILEHATEDQLVACVDLDIWRDEEPDRGRFTEWMRALSSAGEEHLLRAAHAIDPEVLCLWLGTRVRVAVKSDDSFEAPEGAQSLDGQFFFTAREPGDDLADVVPALRVLFQRDYWRYFRLMQAVIWELESDNEEWARRWREGRMQDLGFPTREEALAVYAPLSDGQRERLGTGEPVVDVGEWHLPVWMPALPAAGEGGPALLEAIARLPENEQRKQLFRLIALANRIAVADRMPLGDAETIPDAIRKAVTTVNAGMLEVCKWRDLSPESVLDRASLDDLFRLGRSLEGAPSSG